MRKILLGFALLTFVAASPAFAVIISDTYYFNANNTGLTGGPWGTIQLSEDTSNPYVVSVRVDPSDGAFNIPDSNLFGISRFVMNFQQGTSLASQLAIRNLSVDWSWGYAQNAVWGEGYGLFDFKLRDNALAGYLENPLVFDIAVLNNAFTIGIDDFAALSTGGYYFSGIISGFLMNTANGPVTWGWFAADSTSSVPEPGSFVLLGFGLIGTAMFGRRMTRR